MSMSLSLSCYSIISVERERERKGEEGVIYFFFWLLGKRGIGAEELL